MFFVARGCTARYKIPVTNSASTTSRFALTPTTTAGERIGEPAARRDFPHLFMTEDQLEARMCAAIGI
jgi:hypothetical protein